MTQMTGLWTRLRNRLLADPGFQKRAAAMPLVRIIARRRARTIFDLCSGFVYSQILLACVRLDLFHILKDTPETGGALAQRLDLAPEPTRRLLDGAASLGLLERLPDGRYGLGIHGAALIGNPGIAEMVEHNALLYQDLQDPVAFLRRPKSGTALSRYWGYAEAGDPKTLSEQDVAPYSALMSASQPLVAGEILNGYSFEKHRTLLDVGGGEGRFLIAAGQRHPHLRLMHFDLPAVATLAKAKLAQAGLAPRATVSGGDFFNDSLPAGADIVTLVRILHDHNDDRAARLLANIRRALLPGGTLLIAEPLAGTSGAEPMGEAYFGFYLMAMRSGRPRTRREVEDLLRSAGFTSVRHISTRIPLQTSLIVAQ